MGRRGIALSVRRVGLRRLLRRRSGGPRRDYMAKKPKAVKSKKADPDAEIRKIRNPGKMGPAQFEKWSQRMLKGKRS